MSRQIKKAIGRRIARVPKPSPRNGMGVGVLQSILLVFWVVLQIVVLPYRLFIKLPSELSYILGLFRVICWFLFLLYSDFDAFSEMVAEYKLIQLFVVILPFIGIGFLIASIAVMFGFRYPLSLGYAHGSNYHPNIQSTLDVLDGQLSSFKTRSDFINAFLHRKN